MDNEKRELTEEEKSFLEWMEGLDPARMGRDFLPDGEKVRRPVFEFEFNGNGSMISDFEKEMSLSMELNGKVTIYLKDKRREVFNFRGKERYTQALKTLCSKYWSMRKSIEEAQNKYLLKEFQKGLSEPEF